MFYVITNFTGPTYYLRKTIWTEHRNRASVYATEAEARAAIAKAKTVNPRATRTARIVPAEAGA